MRNAEIPYFKDGVHTTLGPEVIPTSAAQDSLNFVTDDGSIVLVGGRQTVGDAGGQGKITGEHFGYTVAGVKVHYAKFGTTIKYWDGTDWQDSITGLTEDAEYSFANYASLAGAFTFINGPDGYYKICNANPGSAIDIYRSTRNFKAKILIDKGRTILWDRAEDKTGLYGSKIDPQDSTVYTTVTAEAIGALGATNYTGTLAFKAGEVRANCFGVTFTDGTENFTDNYDGTLTGSAGGSGTINYATGEYDITFNVITAGAVTSDYQWEDSSVGGVADFSKSSPRQAAEGFQFPQDDGGDAILKVEVGQDGAYYSMKENSAYRLSIDADDTNATNELYRQDIGIPYWRASVSTGGGIVFMNTANPSQPILTVLQRNKLGDSIEPYKLLEHFDFSNYNYDDASLETYDRWVIVFCKTKDATNNNRMLMCNISDKTVDIVNYTGRMSVQNEGILYLGDSVSQTVYEVFTGYDDLGNNVEAFWESKDERHKTNNLKKTRKRRFKGKIGQNQKVEVYAEYDDSGYELVGTIVGDATYVDYANAQEIGANEIGSVQIGGSEGAEYFNFFMEIKRSCPKYRKRSIKLVPTGIGYFELNSMVDVDILLFEDRLPKRYRSKQKVSLNGELTNQ